MHKSVGYTSGNTPGYTANKSPRVAYVLINLLFIFPQDVLILLTK